MESRFVVRDFTLNDLERVKELHEQSAIDYRFPNLASPLFVVLKVLERDGVIQACGGIYLQGEAYIFLAKDGWHDPAEKLSAVHILDGVVLHEAWMKGIDQACVFLPPGMERFGERLEELGWSKDRPWTTFSKRTS